jgi:mannose-6-phosphate isomerase-like protein (cupin superfamily)
MEIDPGVFVSNVATDDWQFDAETGGEFHVLYEGEDGYAGMSRFVDKADVRLTIAARETFIVLEGAARIDIEGGATLDLKPGDMVSIPEGADTHWRLTLPYKEMWFFPRAYVAATDETGEQSS